MRFFVLCCIAWVSSGCDYLNQTPRGDANSEDSTATESGPVTAPSGSIARLQWASPITPHDTDPHDFGLTRMGDGSLLTVGTFGDSVAFGGVQPNQSLALQGSGGQDIFISRHAPDGTPLGAIAISGSQHETGFDIAATADGGFAVAGAFSGALMVGSTQVTSQGGYDAFVTRYSSTGNLLWSSPWGGAGNDTAYRLALAPYNGLWVGGSISDAGIDTAYVALLTPGGTPARAIIIAPRGSGSVTLHAITPAADGGFYAAGEFTYAMDLGGKTLSASGSSDAWVAHYSNGGGLLWGYALGLGDGSAQVTSLAPSPNGGVRLLGNVKGTVQFAGDTVGTVSTATDAPFMAQLSRNGEPDWAFALESSGPAFGHNFDNAPDGGVYVTGSYSGSLVLGSTETGRGATLSAVGKQDMFVAAYGPDGAFKWAQSAGGKGDDWGIRVLTHGDGAAVLFDADADLGDIMLGTQPDTMVAVQGGDGRQVILSHYSGVR